jgi:hypothetical protein
VVVTVDTFEDDEPGDALRAALEPGERLIWSGRPPRGLMLRGSDAFAIPFSFVWCAFAVFWEWNVITRHAPVLFVLWGAPFIAVGLYLVAGRFAVDVWRRSRTVYGVTDRRVLILTRAGQRDLRSLGLAGVTEIGLHEGPSGRGTLTFGLDLFGTDRRLAIVGRPTNIGLPVFEGIEDAAQVLRTIRNAQKALAQGS